MQDKIVRESWPDFKFRGGHGVIVGEHGHCLAPGHEGSVIVNPWGGHSLATAALKAKEQP